MYEAFYGLRDRPFTTNPDPSFLYWSEAHSLAFTVLRYGLMTSAPITVVTGEIGAGKTTLIRQLIQEVPGDVEVGLISNLQEGRGELIQWVLMALGDPIDEQPYVHLFQRLQNRLIEVYAEGRRTVLIFDEAQNLGVRTLEELRMLSNINSDKDELLQIVLVGQPQLRQLLARPELKQFSQRVSADFHLEALNANEVREYIQHRTEISGAKWRIFPAETCALVHEATAGVPRLINILCDLAMVYGYAAECKVIDEPLLREFLVGARRRGIYEQFRVLDRAPALIRET